MAEKLYKCFYMPCGHLKMVKSHGIYPLTLVMMAASHMAALILKVEGHQPRWRRATPLLYIYIVYTR